MKTWVYFVSYVAPRVDGMGNIPVSLSHEVSRIEDVREMERVISERCNGTEIIVTNYQLMRVEEEK